MSTEEKQNIPVQDDEQAGLDTFFAERTVPVEEAKTGGMSRNVKGLIAGVSALVLLGGGLTAFLLVNRGGDNGGTDTTEPTQAAEAVINASTGDMVSSVEISNGEELRVYQSGTAEESEAAVFTLEGYEDIPLNQNMLSTLTNNLSALNGTLVEENCADLSRYSLDAPRASVKITYEDGAVFEAAVGEVYAIDATKTYLAAGDDVYLVKSSLVSNYLEDHTHFVSSTILEEPAEEAYPIVNSLHVQRTDWDYELLLKYSYDENEDDDNGGTAATHIMYEPVFSYLSVDKSVEVTNGMFGLSALDVIAVHPGEDTLAEAGITDPFCTVTMECDDGNTYVLYFGNTFTPEDMDELCYYAYIEGKDVLYAVSQESAVWATMKPENITSQNIIASYVWDLVTLDVTVGDKAVSFEGNGTGSKDDYVAKKDGVVCDQERFRLFYKFLLSIYGEELCFEEALPAGDPDASVHVVTKDGTEDYTVSFYALTDLTMMVAVDGTPTYKIRTSCLDALEHNIDIFDNLSEEFTTTWQ